ncbi:MAG TPA: ATP-binding protein [Jatrophihabitans sp.]
MSRRLGRVAVAVLIIFVLTGSITIWALFRSANEVDRLATVYAPASDANAAALIYMLDAETAIRGYALSGEPSSLEPYQHAVRKIIPTIDSVGATLHRADDHSLDDALAKQRALAQRWVTTIARPAASSAAAARRVTRASGGRVLFDAFRGANAMVADDLDTFRRELRSDTGDLSRYVFPGIIALVALALLASGYAALRTARAVSRPLRALSDVVRLLENDELAVNADENAGPVEVRTVSAAINRLAGERRRALGRQRLDDRLRSEVRDLTSAIRIGQDPTTIASTLVAGIGRVFDLDLVWLVTFDDARVARLAQRWRPAEGDAENLTGDESSDDLMLRGLANRLWHSGTVLGVSDHETVDQSHLDTRITVPTPMTGARASAIAAIGEGNSAMGLLWLAVTDDPRTWTATELGLIQHVAGELAQSLLQTHVLGQQQAAMRRLREADEAKTALVSTVSHELRTPLTSIIGYLDVLLDSYESELDPEALSMLQVIERNATRLRAMIEDLLKQSELEAGRRAVVLDRTDLAHVLDDVRETITPLAANAQLQLETRRPETGLVVVDGDQRELTQAVVNLAANAVKFTAAGGRVTVSAAPDGDNAEIRISDTGIGIPSDEVPHLFERFFRARNARSAVIPGTGLGLAIVADIVARHNGKIDVSSTLGIGTSFVIHLPLASA